MIRRTCTESERSTLLTDLAQSCTVSSSSAGDYFHHSDPGLLIPLDPGWSAAPALSSSCRFDPPSTRCSHPACRYHRWRTNSTESCRPDSLNNNYLFIYLFETKKTYANKTNTKHFVANQTYANYIDKCGLVESTRTWDGTG